MDFETGAWCIRIFTNNKIWGIGVLWDSQHNLQLTSKYDVNMILILCRIVVKNM